MGIERLCRESSATDRQWAAIAILAKLAGVDAVDLAMRSPTGSFQIFPRCGTCDPALALDAALSACRSRNSRDCDIYFRPARGISASIVMLDDLDRASALRVASGRAHMLIETSPANYQLWLKADRALDETERKAAQEALIRQHGGDTGSKSGEHFGRIPGFKNRKLKYNLPWVNLVTFSIDDAPLAVEGLLSPPVGACALEPAADVSSASPSASASPRSGNSQESHKEFRFACESLRRNVSRDKIVANIADRALACVFHAYVATNSTLM